MSTTIHSRAASGADVLDVDFSDRTVTLIVAPYQEAALVEYRGEIWEELFVPGAFDSVNNIDPQRIRVNREHDRSRVVGKVMSFDTRDPRGLVADIRIAATPLGDETLALASENMLSASVGFGINPRTGQILDRATRTRRIVNAVVDHIALVMQPAYDGAQVLAVRSTPHLDHCRADPVLLWAEMRCDPTMIWARRRLERRP